jgi:hypothetical protein
MDRSNGLDRLNLYHHKIFHQQIYAIAQFELYSAINDRKTDLCRGLNSCAAEFVLQTRV